MTNKKESIFTQNESLVLGSLSTSAEKVMRSALDPDGKFRDENGDFMDKSEALAILKDNPRESLMVLSQMGTGGTITLKGQSDILDILVEDLDREAAQALMSDNLTSERLAELLAGKSDLPSTAAYQADAESLLLAMIEDCQNSSGEIDIYNPTTIFTILSWAHKLKDHEDYSELLEMEIRGNLCVRDFILTALYNRKRGEGFYPGDLSEFGLEEYGFSEDIEIHEFSSDEIHAAKAALFKKRQKLEKDVGINVEAQVEADEVADELDF